MEKLHLYDKILSPLLTEKTTNLSEQNKVVFKVPASANKKNLKTNIEKIFKVNVIKINIINKQKRTKLTRGRKVKVPGFKKAIITLKTILFCSDKLVDFSVTIGDIILSYKWILSIMNISSLVL